MMKDLLRTRYNDSNRDIILSYLRAGGEHNEDGITLTDKQKEYLNRWLFAAAKLREMRYSREQVAKFIQATFNVGRDTAHRDITNAEYVFSASYPINKNFLIQSRIEFLIKKINEAYVDNDLKGSIIATKLERELARYIDMYEDIKPQRSPRVINFIFQNNNMIVTNQTPDQAFDDADDIIKKLEENDDY